MNSIMNGLRKRPPSPGFWGVHGSDRCIADGPILSLTHFYDHAQLTKPCNPSHSLPALPGWSQSEIHEGRDLWVIILTSSEERRGAQAGFLHATPTSTEMNSGSRSCPLCAWYLPPPTTVRVKQATRLLDEKVFYIVPTIES